MLIWRCRPFVLGGDKGQKMSLGPPSPSETRDLPQFSSQPVEVYIYSSFWPANIAKSTPWHPNLPPSPPPRDPRALRMQPSRSYDFLNGAPRLPHELNFTRRLSWSSRWQACSVCEGNGVCSQLDISWASILMLSSSTSFSGLEICCTGCWGRRRKLSP
jgi:hypothetical protein